MVCVSNVQDVVIACGRVSGAWWLGVLCGVCLSCVVVVNTCGRMSGVWYLHVS